MSNMKIDHIGIVVKSIDDGVDQWTRVFGYTQVTETVVNTGQKVKVVFLEKEGSLAVKLIAPSEPSSLISASAQRGGGLHHLCFKCDDIGAQLQELQRLGLRVIAPPQPGEAFEGEQIAFLYAGNGLNIELIDTDKRARRLPKCW